MREKEIGVEGEKNAVVGSEVQTIAEVKERVLLGEWQRQIEERQSRGYSIEEWCQMQGISKGCYYHRLRRVRKHLCKVTGVLPEVYGKKSPESRDIVPLKEIVSNHSRVPASASDENKIEISCGEVKVEFKGSVEKELLQTVLEALRSC